MPFDGATFLEQPGSAMPAFPRRWWHRRDRLDIRPLLWALRNRPEQFQEVPYCILHTPSNHEFWVFSGRGYYGIYRANGCSCNRREAFTFLQQFQFHSAYRAWLRWQRRGRVREMETVNAQFRSHFEKAANEHSVHDGERNR